MICIAGKNSIALNACRWLLDTGQIEKSEVVACVNRTDRGVDGFQPSYKAFCQAKGVEIVALEALYPVEDLIFFSLEYDRIIPVKKFASKQLFNIHFSLLPKYRGMYTSAWPILNNEKVSGVSLHEIDEGIDTGNIIAQKAFKLTEAMTARDLYFTYLEYGFSLFKANFQKLTSGDYKSDKQSEVDASYYAKDSIDYQNLRLNFNCKSYELLSQIRAFTFKEFQLPTIEGEDIESAKALNQRSCLAPGEIASRDGNRIIVATQDLDVELCLGAQPR